MKRISSVFLFSLILFSGVVFAGPPPSSTGAYEIYLKAVLYETQGNLLAARAEILRALQLEPESAHLNFKRAELSFYLGQLAEAKQAIDETLSLAPEESKALILAGQIYWALGEAEEAEKRLEKAVKLSPDEIEPLVTLVLAVTPRDPEKAIKLYKDYLKRHPSSSEIHERLAQLYRSQNKIDKARESWTNSLEFEPGSVRAHLALAQLAEVDADTMTAIVHYKAVLERDSDNLPLLLRVGELQYRNNEMAEAYEAFSQARQIAPESPSANFWMALLHEHHGEWQEAAALLEGVMENSMEPGVLLRLSYYYTQMGEHKKAIDLLERLTREEPENTDFFNYLAIAYEHVGRFSDAAETMLQLVDLDPTNAEYRFYLGTLYDRLKKFRAAEEQLERAIELDPGYDLAMNYLGYSYADRNEKLQEAESLLIRALELSPDKAEYLDSLGWVYYRLENFDDAVVFLERAADLQDDPLIWDHLGDALEKKGDKVKAAFAWDESLRISPDQKSVRKKLNALIKKLEDGQKGEIFFTRARKIFEPWGEIQSLADIKVCEGIKCVSAKGQFSFIREKEFRLEIPGPLSGPVLLVVKKTDGPVEYGALHPQFQTAEVWVKKAVNRMASVITGSIFSEPRGEARDQGKFLALVSSEKVLKFDDRSGSLAEAAWDGPKGREMLSFGKPSKGSETLFPSYLKWEDGETGLSLTLEFQKPLFKRQIEAQKKP